MLIILLLLSMVAILVYLYMQLASLEELFDEDKRHKP